VKGTVTTQNASLTDYCVQNNKKLREYYCNGVNPASVDYSCKCRDGACPSQGKGFAGAPQPQQDNNLFYGAGVFGVAALASVIVWRSKKKK